MDAAHQRKPKPPAALPLPPLAEGEDAKDKDRESKAAPAGNRRGRLLGTVALVAAVLLVLYAASAWSGDADDEGIEDMPPPPVRPPVERKKKLLSDAEVVQVTSSAGWSPQMGALVEKRPPRPCKTTKIAAAVFDPIIYLNKNWKRRAFTCLASAGQCRRSLIEDAEDRRWKPVKNYDATFIFTDAAQLGKLSEKDFRLIYREREGSTYLDVILGGPALSGGMAAQFESLQNYVRTFGCSLNDLSIYQGNRYRPMVTSECLELKAEAAKSSRPIWMWYEPGPDILKSASTMTSSELLKRLGDCSKAGTAKPVSHLDVAGSGPLVGKLMAKPLFIDKARFDVRAYMLVASTLPFTVFFRRGYVRVAKEKSPLARHGLFDSKDASDMSLENFQRHLANGKVTGTHFVDTFLKSSMKRIALLLFQSARPALRRRRGSYQLYALDYVVDDQMRVYLDKAQPYPALDKSSAYDAGSMVADVHDLVMELGEEPTAFDSMIIGDKYGMFELIFSELRETCEGTIYNPCHAFADFNAVPLGKANHKISTAHNAANREHHEETRIKKKLEEEKKAMCKTNKLSPEGKACDKLDQELQRKEFEKLFAEHEESWNINQFRMPKPGEVFAWEVV